MKKRFILLNIFFSYLALFPSSAPAKSEIMTLKEGTIFWGSRATDLGETGFKLCQGQDFISPKTEIESPTAENEKAKTALDELERLGIPFSAEEFVKSAERGDAATVNLFLDAGMSPDIEAPESEGCCCGAPRNALSAAATKGHSEIVKTLIDAGADVNAADEYGETVLMGAAEAGQANIVSLLIENGANIEAKSKYKGTALHRAAWEGHNGVVRVLIEAGAQVDAKSVYGETPLIWATERKHIDVARTLLENGANPNAKCTIDDPKEFGDFYAWTPLMRAVTAGSPELVRLLLEHGADVNQQTYHGTVFSALNWAHSEPRQMFWELLDNGANENTKSEALIWAINGFWGDLEIVKTLIERGANVNFADKGGLAPLSKRGQTPLMYAITWSHPDQQVDLVRLLLELGADPNKTNEDGQTPLMLAAFNNPVEITKLLLIYGADVHPRSKEGNSALMIAAKYSSSEAVQLLLDKGAEVNVKALNGCTALMYAGDYGMTNNALLLLQHGAEINARDKEGKTALIYAAARGKAETVKALIDNHADLNVKDNLGMTALSEATIHGHVEAADVLRNEGARQLSGEAIQDLKLKLLATVTKLQSSLVGGEHTGYDGIEIYLNLQNEKDEYITFEGLKLPVDLKIYTAHLSRDGKDSLGELIYTKHTIWDGVIRIPYDEIKAPKQEGNWGAAQVVLTFPDGRTLETTAFGTIGRYEYR